MTRQVHVFDNEVRVFDDHLWSSQRERYRKRNVHEAEEEDIFLKIIGSLPPDGCFVNIGSAIGYYPLLARRLAPGLAIHAVEPLERHREQFLENISLNGLKPSDFTIHEEGISSSDGRARFPDDGFASCIHKTSRMRWRGFRHTGEIKIMTLDRLLERIGRRVDLCQMDVQGHELDVLEGGGRSLQSGAVTTFLIGTHSPWLHGKCIALLMRHGYEIQQDVYDTREQPDGILVARKLVRGAGGIGDGEDGPSGVR